MAVWEPKLSKPGRLLWDCRKRYILVHGPRKGGKSLAIADKLLRNALSFPGSFTMILTRTIAKGEAGVWRNLTKHGGVIEKWQKAGFAQYHSKKKGYHAGPGYRASSKVPYVELKTSGSPSAIEMHTLAADEKVEDRFKDSTADFIYIVEADSFEQEVYVTMRQCMRSTIVPYNSLQMILDMNPPPEGKRHWAHKFIADPETDETAILFPLQDNVFLSQQEMDDVTKSYAHDPVKTARYVRGEWVEMTEHSCFSDVLNENLVVVGETAGANDDYSVLDDREVLRPWDGAYELSLGYDIGDQFSSVVLGAHRYVGETLCFDVLDEIWISRTPITMEDFAKKVVRMMDYWEAWIYRETKKKPFVRHWSDSSSMRERMSIGGSEAALLYNLTNGRISLTGIQKGRGSVENRKDLLRRLLYENKLAVSTRCTQTLNMLRHLPPKTSRSLRADGGKDVFVHEGIDTTSPFKHAFDALTYLLGQVIPIGLADPVANRTENRSLTMVV